MLSSLAEVQGQKYDSPVILVCDQLGGNEDIPVRLSTDWYRDSVVCRTSTMIHGQQNRAGHNVWGNFSFYRGLLSCCQTMCTCVSMMFRHGSWECGLHASIPQAPFPTNQSRNNVCFTPESCKCVTTPWAVCRRGWWLC